MSFSLTNRFTDETIYESSSAESGRGALEEAISKGVRNFTGLELDDPAFVNIDFSKIDFSFCHIRDPHFENCLVDGCSFRGAELIKPTFNGCRILYTDFTGAYIQRGSFIECEILSSRFQQVNAHSANFYKAKIQDVTFRNAFLCEAGFVDTKIQAAFNDACLIGADFAGAEYEPNALWAIDLSTLDWGFVTRSIKNQIGGDRQKIMSLASMIMAGTARENRYFNKGTPAHQFFANFTDIQNKLGMLACFWLGELLKESQCT
jgi:hypothetical protein